jgi:hypothetical protein
MIKELKEKSFIQICDCGGKREISYDSLSFFEGNKKMIRLPLCSKCTTRTEYLLLSAPPYTTDYAKLIAAVFAQIASRDA